MKAAGLMERYAGQECWVHLWEVFMFRCGPAGGSAELRLTWGEAGIFMLAETSAKPPANTENWA